MKKMYLKKIPFKISFRVVISTMIAVIFMSGFLFSDVMAEEIGNDVLSNIKSRGRIVYKSKEVNEAGDVVFDASDISHLAQEMDIQLNMVANGKIKLAEAIKNKGADKEITNTASFEDIGNAIASIGTAATASGDNILIGKTAYIGDKYVAGTMPNQDGVSQTLQAGFSYAVPQGYHNGKGKIVAATLASQTEASGIAGNLTAGKTAWVNGVKVTGTGADNNTFYNDGYSKGMNDALNGAGITYTYHAHSGDSGGSGCYTAPVYHAHAANCYITTKCDCPGYGQGDFLGNHATDGYPIYACVNCPHQSTDHSSGSCRMETSDIGCGKTDSTIEHYDLGCGKTESTIESATITFK